ncbi:hypothetical protein H311_04299, partial [Anncaliia algerae PRA109]
AQKARDDAMEDSLNNGDSIQQAEREGEKAANAQRAGDNAVDDALSNGKTPEQAQREGEKAANAQRAGDDEIDDAFNNGANSEEARREGEKAANAQRAGDEAFDNVLNSNASLEGALIAGKKSADDQRKKDNAKDNVKEKLPLPFNKRKKMENKPNKNPKKAALDSGKNMLSADKIASNAKKENEGEKAKNLFKSLFGRNMNPIESNLIGNKIKDLTKNDKKLSPVYSTNKPIPPKFKKPQPSSKVLLKVKELKEKIRKITIEKKKGLPIIVCRNKRIGKFNN